MQASRSGWLIEYRPPDWAPFLLKSTLACMLGVYLTALE